MLTIRPATHGDVPTLARLNEQLIEDEGHPVPLRGRALAERMRGWLETDYSAALGLVETETESDRDTDPAVYALWRPDENNAVYLRQFFVARQHRRRGLGTAAPRILREQYWPPATRIRLDVLVTNERGLAFWRSFGFQDHAILMELPAGVRRGQIA
jgi:ribosomal protein S18 acetylase RimI-like enzyme